MAPYRDTRPSLSEHWPNPDNTHYFAMPPLANSGSISALTLGKAVEAASQRLINVEICPKSWPHIVTHIHRSPNPVLGPAAIDASHSRPSGLRKAASKYFRPERQIRVFTHY